MSCSQRKTSSPELCLKLERWQGPPHINKAKQYETVLFLKVKSQKIRVSHNEESLFIQFV